MGERTEPEVMTSQDVRNVGELPWQPSFALREPSLARAVAGETAFEVHRRAGEQAVTVRFETNDRGDAIRAYSPSRPYYVSGGHAAAPWYIEISDHQEVVGIRVPAAAVATFEKPDGPWEYLRVRVTALTPRSTVV